MQLELLYWDLLIMIYLDNPFIHLNITLSHLSIQSKNINASLKPSEGD